MANSQKTFFLIPGWDIPPSAVKLGSIIGDPTTPHRAIISPAAVTDIDTIINCVPTSNFVTSLSNNRSTTLGLWAQFLQIFGLGADAGFSFGRDGLDTYGFQKMNTEWFNPSVAFIDTMVSRTEVRDFLKMVGSRKPLYMVTGTKTVWGATVTTSRSTRRAVVGSVGFDATAVGAPVTVGPEVEVERNRGEETSWHKEGPIIFAYELKKLKLKKDGIQAEDHRKGAMFEIDHSGQETKLLFEIEEIDGHALAKETGQFNVEGAVDEGNEESCLAAIAVADDSW